MSLLFWHGCQNGLHRFHGNILKKSVFLRKIFFPIIFDPWVKISPVLQEGLGLVAVNAFYLCTESFWGKWSFFEQFLSTVFEFLPKKKLAVYRLFPVEFRNCVQLVLEKLLRKQNFLVIVFFSHFRTLKENYSSSWQKNVHRFVKTPFYFSAGNMLLEIFLLKKNFCLFWKLPEKTLGLFVESFNFGVFVKIEATCP